MKKKDIHPFAHPEDEYFFQQMRELAFLSAREFKIPLKVVEHKRYSTKGSVSYWDTKTIGILIRGKNSETGEWDKGRRAIHTILDELCFHLHRFYNWDNMKRSNPEKRLQKKQLKHFLMEKWREMNKVPILEVMDDAGCL